MTTQTTYPTEKMIEDGAKAAYGTIMCDQQDWPNVSGSVPAEYYRNAAKACFLEMMESNNSVDDKTTDGYQINFLGFQYTSVGKIRELTFWRRIIFYSVGSHWKICFRKAYKL